MEPILVPLIVFGFIALVTKMGIDYSKWKQIHRSSEINALTMDTDNSLAVSELKHMIQEAVEEANKPLAKRIARIEDRIDDDRLLAASREPMQLKEASSDD